MKERRTLHVLNETNKDFKLGSTLRVAGGWVRDKLLGKESEDIDIAVDNMLGRHFADSVAKQQDMYERQRGWSRNDDMWTSSGTRYHIFKSNLEKLKPLETALIKLNGLSIELTNLRSME